MISMDEPTAKPEQNITFHIFALLSTLPSEPFTGAPGTGAPASPAGSLTTSSQARRSTPPSMLTPVNAASRLG